MNWHFRKLQPGEPTRDPIVGEFFATEAIQNPAEALVREGIQNALDAAVGDRISIRIVLGQQRSTQAGAADGRWFNGAWTHYAARGNGLREPPNSSQVCNFLLFEDFGTSGLTGSVEQPFDLPGQRNHFFYFFRAEGRSSKHDSDRGRWGVGKHVFPRLSQGSTLFGLTVRADDDRKLLMGRMILKSHCLDSHHYSPDGYFGHIQSDGLVLPVSDPAVVEDFASAFALIRSNEPGLSIVVPWVEPEVSIAHLTEAVLRGYFYPILTKALSVRIESSDTVVEINAGTLAEVASLVRDAGEGLKSTVQLADWAASRTESEILNLIPCDPNRPCWADSLVPTAAISSLRNRFAAGERIALRAHLTVREKDRDPAPSYLDVFLVQDGYEGGRPIFIRDGITISDVRAPRARGVRSLVVVQHGPLANLLGDAENPAHTQWQKDSSHFKGKYTYGKSYIDFVSGSVAAVVHALRAQDAEEDRSVLLDVFSLPPLPDAEPPKRRDDAPKRRPGPQTPAPDAPEHEPRKRRFLVVKTPGGFSIRNGDAGATPPAQLRVRVAYDLRRGNPLSKYHPADFQFGKLPLVIQSRDGVEVTTAERNLLEVVVTAPVFCLTVTGFDVKRDLLLSVRMEDGSNDSQV